MVLEIWSAPYCFTENYLMESILISTRIHLIFSSALICDDLKPGSDQFKMRAAWGLVDRLCFRSQSMSPGGIPLANSIPGCPAQPPGACLKTHDDSEIGAAA